MKNEECNETSRPQAEEQAPTPAPVPSEPRSSRDPAPALPGSARPRARAAALPGAAQAAREPAKWLRHALVCLDRSALGERALPFALSIARTWGARLTLLHVLEPERHPLEHLPSDALDWEVFRAESRMYLDRVRQRVGRSDLPSTARILQGHVAEQIVREGRESRVDLTVLSSHGERGLSGWAMGSTAQMVVSRAQGSLLIVPAVRAAEDAGTEVRFRRIMAPLDGSQRAECVLPVLVGLAREHAAELLLTHVVPEVGLTCPGHQEEEVRQMALRLQHRNEQAAERYLDQVRRRLGAEDLRVRTVLHREAEVWEALLGTVQHEDVDLLVMAAHGQTGRCDRPYGSVAQSVLSRGSVPLLLIQDVAPDEMSWQLSATQFHKVPRPHGAGLCRGESR